MWCGQPLCLQFASLVTMGMEKRRENSPRISGEPPWLSFLGSPHLLSLRSSACTPQHSKAWQVLESDVIFTTGRAGTSTTNGRAGIGTIGVLDLQFSVDQLVNVLEHVIADVAVADDGA